MKTQATTGSQLAKPQLFRYFSKGSSHHDELHHPCLQHQVRLCELHDCPVPSARNLQAVYPPELRPYGRHAVGYDCCHAVHS